MDGPNFTKKNEGCRLAAYQDQLGNWTIGYGHTGPEVRDGIVWTQAECDAVFEDDYAHASEQAQDDVGNICWSSLNDVRQASITDMAFNLGGRNLAQFKTMIGCLMHGDFEAAAEAALASKWADQLPVRSKAVAFLIRTGTWPGA